MTIFQRLFHSLNHHDVKYLVAGGIAVNLYGIERATADVDIIVHLEKENLLKFVQVAEDLALKPKAPVKLHDFIDPEKRRSWIADKAMMVFSLYDTKNPFFLLDVFVESPFNFEDVYKKRKDLTFEDTTIPVVPIKTLVEMKQGSDRPQDRADIYYLKRIEKDWEDEE